MRLLLSLLLLGSSLPALAATKLDRLVLPKGFHVALYADQVPNAREMAVGANGTVFVGSTGAGKVYALTDRDGDGVAEQVRVIANGLQGTYLHARGVSQKPGGWKLGLYNVEMGPPLFAPLLATLVGGMGLLASILRREEDPKAPA